MKALGIILLCLFLGLTSGCTGTMTTTTTNPDGSKVVTEQPGSMFGPSSYDVGFYGIKHDWRAGQAARADSIQKIACPTDAVAAAYCGANKMMGIAMISTERDDTKSPTTGFDVLAKGVDVIVPVAGFYSLYKLGSVAAVNAGSKFGDNASVTNSMNHTEANPNVIGSNSTSNPTSTSTPSNVPATDSYNTTNPVTTTTTP